MFLIQPKNKFYTPSELTCCQSSLGGRTETEWFDNDDALSESVVDNGNGTYTSTWSYTTDPTFDERLAFILCCATEITITWSDLLQSISINDGDYEESTDFVSGPLTSPLVIGASVLNRGACGNNIEFRFGPTGSGSFSITY